MSLHLIYCDEWFWLKLKNMFQTDFKINLKLVLNKKRDLSFPLFLPSVRPEALLWPALSLFPTLSVWAMLSSAQFFFIPPSFCLGGPNRGPAGRAPRSSPLYFHWRAGPAPLSHRQVEPTYQDHLPPRARTRLHHETVSAARDPHGWLAPHIEGALNSAPALPNPPTPTLGRVAAIAKP